MANQASAVKTSDSNAKKVVLVERKPQPDWFATARNEHGKRQVFLRFQMTGLYPRRFGPFQTKREALLFLDDVLNQAQDVFCESEIKGNHARCIMEDELASRYLPGRHRKGAHTPTRRRAKRAARQVSHPV